MKVLLIDVNCKHSSTGKITYDIYSFLNQNGDNAVVCYGRGPVIEETNIFKFGLDWETYLHAALARLTGLNGCYSFFSTRRLMKYIENYKPDVIHIHELHAYFVNYTQLLDFIYKRKIPVIWTFHCEYMYTGKCGYAYDCQKWKEDCGNCPDVAGYPKSMIFDRTRSMLRTKKRLLNNLDFTIVAPSKWLADRVWSSFLKNKDIRVIHNGIDTREVFFPRSSMEIQLLRDRYKLNQKKIVLSVAPNIMEERKGGKTVLRIAEDLKDIQFVLVGTDDSKIYSDNVLLIKRTKDQNELAIWYSMADLFLICSNKENYPTTCLEAFSCGTAVVGFDSGGTKETVPAPYGSFVEYGDIVELEKLIIKTMNSGINKQSIRNISVDYCSKEEMCELYKALYKEVLNRC